LNRIGRKNKNLNLERKGKIIEIIVIILMILEENKIVKIMTIEEDQDQEEDLLLREVVAEIDLIVIIIKDSIDQLNLSPMNLA
jgi:hypothetical protein